MLAIGIPIIDNESLSCLEGLEYLDVLESDLQVWSNKKLVSLDALSNLTTIGGRVLVINNDAMTGLSGLESVTSISGDLNISYNANLSSLISLNELETVKGGISILANDALSSLSGMDNIEAGSITYLRIKRNTLLSECEVQTVCDFIASPDAVVSIVDNARGCNNIEEVEEACDTVVMPDKQHVQSLLVYPNPMASTTTLAYNIVKSGNIHLAVYNRYGEPVRIMLDGYEQEGSHKITWNTSEIPSGVYFCILRTEMETQTTKMIKMK